MKRYGIPLLGSMLVAASSMAVDLPDWSGKWTGTCKADGYNSDLPKSTVDMTLEISKTDDKTLLWKIQYGGEPMRDYVMNRQDDLDGH